MNIRPPVEPRPLFAGAPIACFALSLLLLAGGCSRSSTESSGAAASSPPATPETPGGPAYSFTVLVRTGSVMPSGTDKFARFGPRPALAGTRVAFLGLGRNRTSQGLFLIRGGGVATLADLDTHLPGDPRTFSSVSEARMDGDDIVFFGEGTPLARDVVLYSYIQGSARVESQHSRGLFRYRADRLESVIGETTPIPGGTGSFAAFGETASPQGGRVAFTGYGASGQQGVYRDDGGSLAVVADLNTPVPGGDGAFSGFGATPALHGDRVVFIGHDSANRAGLYAGQAGRLEVIADRRTQPPPGTNRFTRFSSPVANDDRIAFVGHLEGSSSGIFISDRSGLRRVAGTDTRIPDASENFSGFGEVALADHGVVFHGRGASITAGIYGEQGGRIYRIVDTRDSLDGKAVRNIHFGSGGSQGGSLVLVADFVDGSGALIRADPSP